jgi:hypothetical protein
MTLWIIFTAFMALAMAIAAKADRDFNDKL